MKKKKTVLVIDDDILFTKLVERHLENQNYEVSSVDSGIQGLKSCSENNYDLVILDVTMPRMDGYLVLEHMRQRWENGSKSKPFPNVLVVTSIDKKEDMGLAENLGASAYLRKPYKKEKLIQKVKELTG